MAKGPGHKLSSQHSQLSVAPADQNLLAFRGICFKNKSFFKKEKMGDGFYKTDIKYSLSPLCVNHYIMYIRAVAGSPM